MPVELSTYASNRLVCAMDTSFSRPVTAYLTDAYFIAGCCIGVIHRHVKADAYGRFKDGHRVRTSDVIHARQCAGFWTLHTVTGSLYVIVTFKKQGGRHSLGILLELISRGIQTSPRMLQ